MTTRGETFTIPLKQDQAFDLRDAFAKGIYSKLFDWLVGRINIAICSTKNVKSHIGLLDIFGFESFDHNGFEQLCINYANEKLQQKFNSDIFKTVQTEYIEEGIPLDLVTFEDNQPILDLIEGKLGIVDMLNETGLQPKGDDRMFVNKVNESFADHKNYEKIRTNPMQFKIIHYAGDVTYDGTKFLDKNKDTLPSDLMELLASSQSSFIRDVFPELAANNNTKDKNSKRRQGFLVGNTIAGSFRRQLSELMDEISKTATQYVRCIKPNSNKSATEFNRHMVVDQLRCAGVIAAIRISRAAFPNRLSLKEFTSRFAIICPSKLRKAAPEAMILGLLEILGITEKSTHNTRFAIGRTKVYFSSGLLQHLEDQRAVVLRQYATCIQARMRGYVVRKRYLVMRQSAVRVQTIYRMHVFKKQYKCMKRGAIGLQKRARGFQARKRYKVLIKAERARKEALSLAELERAADAKLKAEANADIKIMEEDSLRTSSNLDEPIDSSSDDDRLSASSQSILTSAASRVAEAEAAAVEAQKAAMAALTHNRVIQAENESLRAKLAAYVAEHADAELLRENERLKHQVLTLQSKLVRAQEVSLISAKVVDSRITFREGRQFVEYKLQIETNNRGTLYVWHRYSTFRNLATTLQTKNGYRKKDIPDLPNKQLFGNFTDRIIQERIQKLNEFLDAATNTDYLQWGIRVDQDTCVYKRRSRNSTGNDRESIAIGRESMALTHSSSTASEDTTRDSLSTRESFSIRESLSNKFSLRRSKH
ncbi:myosin [Thraustotheca clavata]|uniref:Myosin n=1 Tax=Thraustotheca clavata TaxID=74557 RepID=A0A1V9ZVX6_9STRA|nr:myosin [Thraustotheca clavata]